MSGTLYTIGHSNHSSEALLELLRRHGVNAVADVRSHPYSRLYPQFGRELLAARLTEAGIAYAYLGQDLGARPDDPGCYVGGKVDFSLLAATPAFQRGLDGVEAGMRTRTVALLCAEKDPLTCHRTLLVARHLRERGVAVSHILADGTLETHEAALVRLLREYKLAERDLFHEPEEVIAEAYALRGAKIAYEERPAAGADRGEIE